MMDSQRSASPQNVVALVSSSVEGVIALADSLGSLGVVLATSKMPSYVPCLRLWVLIARNLRKMHDA